VGGVNGYMTLKQKLRRDMRKKSEGEKTCDRKIGVFTRWSSRTGKVGTVAIDLDRIVCLTIAKSTGDVVLQVLNGDGVSKENIVLEEYFTEALRIWKSQKEVAVFHVISDDPGRSHPCAIAVKDINSIETSNFTGMVIVRTSKGTFDLRDSFERAVQIWAA